MTVEKQLRGLGRHLDAQQAPVTTDEIIARARLETLSAGEKPGGGGAGRRRLAMVIGIAAALLVALGGWLTTGGDDATELVPAVGPTDSMPPPTTGGTPTESTTSSRTTPAPPEFPASVPEAPFSSTRPNISIVALVQRDGVLGVSSETGDLFPLGGEFELPDGTLGDQRILDTASTGGGFYLILCCDPGPMLWRNGTPWPVAATRIQLAIDFSTNIAVDDVGDTLSVSGEEGNLGDLPIATMSIPGLIDAAATSERLLALVAGEDPHLLAHDWFQPGRTFDETTLERLEVPFADDGPCSIVPVNDDFLVLYGTSDGVDRCIGDRAALVDGGTGDLVSALRLPGISRQMNAGGHVVTIVTTNGRVLVGEFVADNTPASEPKWTTIVQADAVGASVGFS